MDIKKIILQWYNRHSNFLDATLDIASDLVPGGKIITNLLKATKAIYDDDRNSINQQISQDQILEITNFLQNIQPVILNLMEEVEELKDFKDSISIKERKKILEEGSFKEQLQKVIPRIASSLTETVNKTKSSKNLINNLYLKLETLGQGGEGTVYKCINTQTDLVVALKILLHKLGSDGYELLKKEYERLIKKLLHGNIVQYRELAIDKETEHSYLVMDFLEGQTLRSLMIKKRLSEDKVFTLDETISLLTGVSKALDHAHNNDVLHLDLKPENILVDTNKESYLFDFGLSQDIKHTLVTAQCNINTTSKGTLAYMAPEQYKGKKRGIQTDIWAFGVIIYEMLSGIHPFDGSTFEHFYKLVCEEELEEIEEVSEEVNKILRQALTKTRKNRLENANDILNRLKDTKKEVVVIEDNKEQFINIELPTIAGYYYKYTERDKYEDEKTKITAGNIVLNSNEYLGVEPTSNEDFEKVINLSDLILDKIKFFDLSCYKEITDEEIKKLSCLQNLQKLDLSGCDKISDKSLEYILTLENLQTLDLWGCDEINDKSLESISKLENLQKLDLSGCDKISDNGLEYLSKLKNLQTLDLCGCDKISDKGLEYISNLQNLQYLNLYEYNQISDKGLEYISNIKNLQILCLKCNNQITDKGLEYIFNIKNLQDLSLRFCDQISDKGLECISNIKNLQMLDLAECRIRDDGLSYISNLQSLQDLSLRFCDQISDKGLEFISNIKNLQMLDLAGCKQISDKGLEYLSKLQNLKYLNLYYCDQISDNAVKKLQEQLKSLKIDR